MDRVPIDTTGDREPGEGIGRRHSRAECSEFRAYAGAGRMRCAHRLKAELQTCVPVHKLTVIHNCEHDYNYEHEQEHELSGTGNYKN